MRRGAAGGTAARAAWVLPVLLAAAQLSCTARLTRPEGFPPPGARLALAPYRQAPEGCGPFALAAVLGFFGLPITAEELVPDLYLPSIRGTLTMDMLLVARRKGLPAAQGEGSLARVRQELAAGRPVILLLRYPSLAGGAGHFVVATGFSPPFPPSHPRPGIFLLWGDGRESWMEAEALDLMWERSERWMLTFAPAEGGG